MKILAIAALAAGVALAATPASAQHGGGGHGGGGFHGGGGGFHGGGFRGGYGYRGGFGIGFGFGGGCFSCGYYGGYPYYDPYYGYPGYGYPDYDYQPAYAPPPPDYSDQPPPPPPAQPQANNDGPNEGDWYVTRRRGETDYEVPDKVLFGLDSAHVSANADEVLNQIADAARQQPNARLVVEGHTDTSGTPQHNQELSDDRARAVADVLVREGVSQSRIRSEGMGERGLAVETGDGVREPRNRRVVVRLLDDNARGARMQDPHMDQRMDQRMGDQGGEGRQMDYPDDSRDR